MPTRGDNAEISLNDLRSSRLAPAVLSHDHSRLSPIQARNKRKWWYCWQHMVLKLAYLGDYRHIIESRVTGALMIKTSSPGRGICEFQLASRAYAALWISKYAIQYLNASTHSQICLFLTIRIISGSAYRPQEPRFLSSSCTCRREKSFAIEEQDEDISYFSVNLSNQCRRNSGISAVERA
jgi:hypothetical protein